jgi:hypothetical protein
VSSRRSRHGDQRSRDPDVPGAVRHIPLHVERLGGVVPAFYEVVSTPAGALPDRVRDKPLHASGARIRLSRLQASGDPELEVLTLNELYDRHHAAARDNPFHVREIDRVTLQFGIAALA